MGYLWHKEIMTRKGTNTKKERKSFDKTPEELYIYIIEVEINFIFVVGIKLSVNVVNCQILLSSQSLTILNRTLMNLIVKNNKSIIITIDIN
jgi:hypothetical protein